VKVARISVKMRQKKMLKQVLEPIVLDNVRRIVNDSVDELFKSISSSSNVVSNCQSQPAKHRGQASYSSPTNHSVNSLEMQNNIVSSRPTASKLKGEDSAEIPGWKLAWNFNQDENLEFFSDQSSGTSDLSPGFKGSNHGFNVWDPSCRRSAGMKRVSVLKLDTFQSDISLDQTEVGLNSSKPTSGEERCLGVNDTGAEKVRKIQTILTDEKSITKLAGDAKISFVESITLENQHGSKILTPLPDGKP